MDLHMTIQIFYNKLIFGRLDGHRFWGMAVLILAAAPLILFPGPVSAQLTVTNVGVDAGTLLLVKDRVAFIVSEDRQGATDLNADGDSDDTVLHIFDAKTGTNTNIELAVPRRQNEILLDKNRVAFIVTEEDQGATDLNADGDSGDTVLHVFDAKTGTLTNVGLEASDLLLDKDRVAFVVSERDQGTTDFNADGDSNDFVLHLFDAKTGTLTNVGLDARGGRLDKDRVAFSVSENDQGTTDLNGDGDTSDSVLHVFNAKTGTLTNVGLAVTNFEIDKDRIVFSVFESSQGATDLNGDGDASDFVLHVFDAKAGTVTNVGLDSGFLRLDKKQVAFRVSESRQGATDLNGDGDTSDFVLHVLDAKTGTVTNVGRAVGGFQLEKDRVVFRVSEDSQGSTDLNGDGDTSDSVLHLFDAKTGTTTNLGFDANAFTTDKDRIAFIVSESGQGATDLNADGDASDSILHLFDAKTGTTTNIGLDSGFLRLDEKQVAFRVSESRQGATDLNGDGDTSDFVLHVLDAKTGTVTNVGRAVGGFQLDKDRIAFSVSESAQGATDLNGDGDTSDFVLHVGTVQ